MASLVLHSAGKTWEEMGDGSLRSTGEALPRAGMERGGANKILIRVQACGAKGQGQGEAGDCC